MTKLIIESIIITINFLAILAIMYVTYKGEKHKLKMIKFLESADKDHIFSADELPKRQSNWSKWQEWLAFIIMNCQIAFCIMDIINGKSLVLDVLCVGVWLWLWNHYRKRNIQVKAMVEEAIKNSSINKDK